MGCSSITVFFTVSSATGPSSLRATCGVFRGRPLRRRGVRGGGSEPAGGGGGGDGGVGGWSWWGGSEVWPSADVSVDSWKLSGPETCTNSTSLVPKSMANVFLIKNSDTTAIGMVGTNNNTE